jgi:NADH-quinone oxidoreductase subunit J
MDSFLLVFFALAALVGAVMMLVMQSPMRVAIALITVMLCLAGVYGVLGVHFIAAFQVLIYVGAVMVFMVYTIMLLDPRENHLGRYSRLAFWGVLALPLLLIVLRALLSGPLPAASTAESHPFGMGPFAIDFIKNYWLHFELTSVLLLAGLFAALAVIKVTRKSHG